MTGGKREIGWKRRDAEGQRVQVKAQKTGNRWHFHIRGRSQVHVIENIGGRSNPVNAISSSCGHGFISQIFTIA